MGGTNGKKRDYKRSTYEQEQEMWDTNAQIMRAKMEDKRAQRHVDEGYKKIDETVDALGKLVEDGFAKQNIQRRQQFDAANVKLAQEQRERALKEKAAYCSYATP